MRFRALLIASCLLLTAGCGQAAAPMRAPLSDALGASAAKLPAEVSEALAKFTKAEGRKVTAANVPLNEGRGAAELRVTLNPSDKALLVQLYRLHPRNVEASTFPEGLVARSYEHLATLYHFKFPTRAGLDQARLSRETKTRVYRDGEGNVLAYETWLPGDDFQLFGKYDLKGRILKIDLETWQN